MLYLNTDRYQKDALNMCAWFYKGYASMYMTRIATE